MKLRIKELMEEKGVTSVSMAAAIGVHKVSFSNIINGKINPSAETLEKIADALGVEMWELFKSKKDIAEELSNTPSNTVTCPKCGHEFAVEIKAKEE